MDPLLHNLHLAAQREEADLGFYLEAIVGLACRHIPRRGQIAVDVGAHQGEHTMRMAAAVGRTGRVHAFEPLPDQLRRLRKQIKRQRAHNVSVHEEAVGRTSGHATFCHFANRPAYSGLIRRATPFSDEEGGRADIPVRVTTLDTALGTDTRVSFLKLDIEGGELFALMGARQILEASRPVIVFESGRQSAADTYGYSADEFFTFFDQLGLRVFGLTGWELTRSTWNAAYNCWEFVALPEERAHEIERFKGWSAEVAQLSTADLPFRLSKFQKFRRKMGLW